MVSGAAFAQTSGSAGVNLSKVDTDFGDLDSYGVDGEIIIPTGGAWSTILGATIADSDDTDTSLEGTAHLINNGANNAWGGFVGLGNTDDSTTWVIGGEYAQFFDASTLAFNVTYGNNDDADVDGFGVNGAYRIFASDNLRFDIGAGFARAESNGFDADVWTLGAGVEYRFAASPFSIGAGYTRADSDFGDADIFGISFRYNFGNETLKQADRAGKTFTGLGTATQGF